MRLRWISAVVAAMGMVLGMMAPARAQSPPPGTAPAGPQGLNDVLIRLLSNNCTGLGAGPFGPDLTRICAVPGTGGGSASGGTVGAESRFGAGEEQRQSAASADADGTSGLSAFVSTEYQKFNKDTTRFETGFDRDTAGASVGVDYLLRGGMVLGAAVSYAHEFGDYDGVGGGFDHDAYGILVYGSVVPVTNMFVDAVAGYTRKDYGFERRASLSITGRSAAGPTSGDTDGNEFKVAVNTGYDFLVGRFTFGPRAGINYRETTIDAFRESGHTGLELAYDNQIIRSLTTTVGLYGSVAVSTGFGVIVPQATAEYVHEFLDDQRSVGFSFVQDPARRRFLFQTDPPDRDYFNLGVGMSMVLANGMQPFLNFRELVGYKDRSSHTVTLGLRVPF
jgi:outer membrane lipase/esterase